MVPALTVQCRHFLACIVCTQFIDAICYYKWSGVVCLCVEHEYEPCEKGWTDEDRVLRSRVLDLGAPGEYDGSVCDLMLNALAAGSHRLQPSHVIPTAAARYHPYRDTTGW